MKEKTVKNLWHTAPLTFFAAALLPEYVAPVLMVVCFILVLKNKINSKTPARPGSNAVSLALFYCWMIVAAFWSSGIVTSLASLGLWLLMFTAYFYFTEVLDSEDKIEKTMYFGCLSSGIAGAVGMGQMVLFHYGDYIYKGRGTFFNPFWHFLDVGISKLVFILPQFIQEKMPRTTFNVFPTRACSTFTNPLFFSAIEVILLPFAAYCFLCAKERKHRIIGLFCLALSIGGIASSYSRGPYLAAVIVFVILLLYGGKKTLKLGAMGLGALGLLLIFASGIIKRLFTLFSTKDISVNTRTQIWAAAFDMIKKHPVFGYGTGFDNVRQLLHNDYGIMQPHAHNIFLEIWVENGIFGVILFAAFLFVFALNILKLFKKGGSQRCYAVTLFASVAGFVLCGMTDCLFYGLKPLQYFMMVMGIAQAVFTLCLGDEEIFLIPKAKLEKIFRKK